MTHKELEEYLLSFPNTWLDLSVGAGTSVYKVGRQETDENKMFAIVANNTKPLQLSLRCDPLLAETLRAKYETVVPGHNLNKRYWNTIILTGQLSDDEIRDLARLSYNLAAGS